MPGISSQERRCAASVFPASIRRPSNLLQALPGPLTRSIYAQIVLLHVCMCTHIAKALADVKAKSVWASWASISFSLEFEIPVTHTWKKTAKKQIGRHTILWWFPKKNQFGTGRSRIPMGLTISTMLLPSTNRRSHGLNSGALTKF